MNDVESRIRTFIQDNFMFRDNSAELSGSQSLLDAGLIDSTGVLELVGYLESEFNIRMADSDIVPVNLDSIDGIVRYVGRMRADLVAA